MQKQDDEINVIDSLSFFRNIFTSIGNAVKGFFSFTFRNIILLIIFFVIGLAGGFAHFKFSKPVYSAELILASNYIDNDICSEIIEKLQGYVDDKTPELLGKKLDITTEEAEKIKKIRFSNFNEKIAEKYKDADTVVLGMPFRVNVLVSDFTVYPVLQDALMGYFEKNPFVIQQKNIRQTNNQLIINKIQTQQIELDSLKKVVSNHLVPRGAQNGFVFGQPLDPLNIYREVISLYKEELEIKADIIRTAKNTKVIQDFEVREKPYRPKFLLSLAVCGMLGLILGYFICIAKAYFRK